MVYVALQVLLCPTTQNDEKIEDMLKRADQVMYQKKKDYYEYFTQTVDE